MRIRAVETRNGGIVERGDRNTRRSYNHSRHCRAAATLTVKVSRIQRCPSAHSSEHDPQSHLPWHECPAVNGLIAAPEDIFVA